MKFAPKYLRLCTMKHLCVVLLFYRCMHVLNKTMGVMEQHKYIVMGAKHVYEHLENWIICAICLIEKEKMVKGEN